MSKTNLFIISSLIINSIASFAFAMDNPQGVILPQNQLVSLEGITANQADEAGAQVDQPKNSQVLLDANNMKDIRAIGILFLLAALISFLLYKRTKLEKFKRLMPPAAIYHIRHYLEGRRR